MIVKGKTKICNRCNKELPATPEYFWRDRTKKDGLHTICKECKKPKPKKEEVVKEGYKICNRCGRELQATNKYFWKDSSKKDGLQTICRECKGSNVSY